MLPSEDHLYYEFGWSKSEMRVISVSKEYMSSASLLLVSQTYVKDIVVLGLSDWMLTAEIEQTFCQFFGRIVE
jgi:hypothetical protein